ncbi:MAG: efflux RND transporter periplasmic adaptor subunit [Planctomycetes bacterium]|jgi:multidrug efflux system membrane fusion protein|nr:efflux RND transporter periplasmic adaptor subunit [Planctomycetota bacterium]
MPRYVRSLGISALFMTLNAGCERGAPRIAAPETPIVPVSHPAQRAVKDYVYYTGRANAKHAVTIQPRVTGYLMKMPFKEGADVKKDDVLFEIDPRPYAAQLDAAKAAVAQNEANVRYAKATNLRFKELDKKQKGAVSERELDQYQAQEDQAIANLNLAKANLASAKLNLDWTVIKAPIDGHISRYFLTVGNLVNQDTTQLTTLVSMDPMYVYFDMDEPTLLRIKRAINEGRIKRAKEGSEVPIQISLPGEDGYPNAGTINFVDNQINPGTGSISVRGVLSNPKPKNGTHLIVPGMFVRVRLPIGQPKDELLVIDRAITSNQGLKYVYVLDKDKKVEERRVTLGSLQDDGMRVVTQGLKKDDWVLIGGLQQVRPRMTVQPDYLQNMPSLSEPALPKAKKG